MSEYSNAIVPPNAPQAPPTITTMAQLAARAESSNNQWGVRFEPGWKASLRGVGLVAQFNKCNTETATQLAKMSWGFYQIMGDNLYSMGLALPVGAYLSDRALQETYYHRFCESRGISITLEQYIGDRTLALNYCHHYNGDIAVYSAYLNGILAKDGQKVTWSAPAPVPAPAPALSPPPTSNA